MKTINDINNANRAMWDSGEFQHNADTRHPAQGGQEVHRGEQVVTSHDDTPKRRVHLPRNAGRRWRGSSWDGTDASTVIEDGAEEKAALEKVNSLRAQETPIHLQNKEQREGSRKLHSVAAYLATGKKLTPEQKKHI